VKFPVPEQSHLDDLKVSSIKAQRTKAGYDYDREPLHHSHTHEVEDTGHSSVHSSPAIPDSIQSTEAGKSQSPHCCFGPSFPHDVTGVRKLRQGLVVPRQRGEVSVRREQFFEDRARSY